MNEVQCPKCGSTQITANKKGFSVGKAIVGELVAGPIGAIIAGAKGNNQVIITCLACGNEFKPGEGVYEEPIGEDALIDENDFKNAIELNNLVKKIRESLWIGNSDIKKVEIILHSICNNEDECMRIIKAYRIKFNLDVIDDLKNLSANYQSIYRFLCVFIEFEIVEEIYPHDYKK